MYQMFYYAKCFDGDISRWDVSSVTLMHAMFGVTKRFDGYILGWDVSRVTDMDYMFYNVVLFNVDISG